MTSSAIQDITGISYAGGSRVQGKKSAFDPADESVGSFQNAMNLAKGNGQDAVADRSTQAKTAQSVSVQKTAGYEYQADSKKDTAQVTDAKADSKTGESKETGDPAVKAAVDKKAEETEKEAVKEIADALDVSEEEVREAMEALGLTFMDLTNQADMAALVTRIMADGDSTAMLTDEGLFSAAVDLAGQITDLIQTNVTELTEELPADFSKLMDMMTEAAVKEEAPMEAEPLKQSVIAEGAVDTRSTDDGVSYEIINKTDESQTSSAAQKDGAEVQQTEVSHMSNEQADSKESDSDGDMMNHADAHPMLHVQETDTAAAPEVPAAPESYTQVDAQDIIDQIARHVRVENNAEFSEVEMSLHPASLGNIHLQVTAREGVITAQITAENEAVRDALSVQAMVLKEELNEQGLKIEAVEVTVASHEFEQNMQGENGENTEQMYEEQVKKETRRRVMISGLEEAEELLADEDLSEAERIRIEMMAKSGSSMDMLA